MIDPDEELIRPIAYGFSKTYRMVERADIAQELRLWWLEPRTQDWLEKNYEPDGGDSRMVAKALRSAASRFCRREKAARLGYRIADEHFYDSELIRRLLPLVWHPERIIQEQVQDVNQGPVKRVKPASEGNNLVALVADVGSAVTRIPKEMARLLFLKYGVELEYKDIASSVGLGVDAVEMRVQRAVNQMVQVLGGVNPWHDGVQGGPGSRHAISNAAARAVTSQQENG